MTISLYLLTCANTEEASSISQALLEQKLVACVKQIDIASQFRWKGNIEQSKEVLLLIDSVEENFDRIHALVKELHSYDTFNLISIPINLTTQAVRDWMKEELR